MSDNTTVLPTGKPMQRLKWNEKIKNKKEYFKRSADYYINLSSFRFSASTRERDIDLLYQVYNNEFPKKWFAHITDPLNAKNPNHKKYPGKIRRMSFLRTNIDLLLGEYPRRPFVY